MVIHPLFFGDEDYLAEYLHELARSILVAPADGTEIKLEVRHELVVNLPQGDVRHFIYFTFINSSSRR